MNKYVRKLLGMMFQGQQTQRVSPVPLQHSPTSSEEWRTYWQAKGFPWRAEPEIDEKRQRELSQRRAIVPDIKQGIYPFKGMKLSRADVEWLLATHEHGQGPVDWNDEHQRSREGLDLRGADLSQENLSHLPLAYMQGGLPFDEWELATEEQRNMAAGRMEQADLEGAQLQGANLGGAQLQRANLNEAQLQEANLGGAQLQEAYLRKVQLQGAFLGEAQLQGVHLRGSNLDGATLDAVKLSDEIYGSVRLADVRWGDVSLTVVDWEPLRRLGDEQWAHQKKDRQGKIKTKRMRLGGYKAAVRANRQLAVVLQDQGLDEEAARFAYRAKILQRKVLWKQRNFWKWFGSAILALLAGYGYRMWRILVAYLVIVLLCATAYFVLGMYYEPHLSLLESVLTSITAFHGRVFSEPFLRPGEPQLWVTAFEAVAGLVIEGVFIAMLTQKFFGK